MSIVGTIMDGSRHDRWSRHAGVRWNPLALVIPAKSLPRTPIRGGNPGEAEGRHQPHPNTSNDQVPFSYLRVPAPASMGDWYENALKRLSSAPLNPSIPRSRHSGLSIRHSGEGRNPGEAEGRHQPHPNISNDQVPFSYPGVPAPASIGDCYESMSRTPIRDRPPD